jgi:hypothetical protein
MSDETFEYKRDQYLDERGGRPHFLNIYCDHCGNHLLLYQKDNPGKLKRLYLDRMIAPKQLVELNNLPIVDIPLLRCPDCNRLVAIAEEYDKEPRKVYLLLSFSTTNKVSKGVYPPAVARLDISRKRK